MAYTFVFLQDTIVVVIIIISSPTTTYYTTLANTFITTQHHTTRTKTQTTWSLIYIYLYEEITDKDVSSSATHESFFRSSARPIERFLLNKASSMKLTCSKCRGVHHKDYIIVFSRVYFSSALHFVL